MIGAFGIYTYSAPEAVPYNTQLLKGSCEKLCISGQCILKDALCAWDGQKMAFCGLPEAEELSQQCISVGENLPVVVVIAVALGCFKAQCKLPKLWHWDGLCHRHRIDVRNLGNDDFLIPQRHGNWNQEQICKLSKKNSSCRNKGRLAAGVKVTFIKSNIHQVVFITVIHQQHTLRGIWLELNCVRGNIRSCYLLTSNSASTHLIKINKTSHLVLSSSSKDALSNGTNQLFVKHSMTCF